MLDQDPQCQWCGGCSLEACNIAGGELPKAIDELPAGGRLDVRALPRAVVLRTARHSSDTASVHAVTKTNPAESNSRLLEYLPEA